jgi:hypothetical protein
VNTGSPTCFAVLPFYECETTGIQGSYVHHIRLCVILSRVSLEYRYGIRSASFESSFVEEVTAGGLDSDRERSLSQKPIAVPERFVVKSSFTQVVSARVSINSNRDCRAIHGDHRKLCA